MKHKYIPYGRQNISDNDVLEVNKVLTSDWLTQGPKVKEFENEISLYFNSQYTLSTNSATSALHLACLSLGLGKGDELWTSPVTFVASANCGLYCNAKVDFVDINDDDLCIDLFLLEEKLSYRKLNKLKLPKVLVIVHLSGQSTNMKKIKQLSDEYGFSIIEDASHAIGAKYKNKLIGSCHYSDITVFSLHPVKIITSGEGGLLTTNNQDLYKKMEKLRSHGITKFPEEFQFNSKGPWYYEQQLLGFNYRMTDIHAALGLSQLSKLEKFVSERNKIAQFYDKEFDKLEIKLQKLPKDSFSSRHLYIIRLDENIRLKVFKKLVENKIGANLHYSPVHLQPFYRKLGFKEGDYPISEQYEREAISIPIYPGLKKIELQKIVNIITKSITKT